MDFKRTGYSDVISTTNHAGNMNSFLFQYVSSEYWLFGVTWITHMKSKCKSQNILLAVLISGGCLLSFALSGNSRLCVCVIDKSLWFL